MKGIDIMKRKKLLLISAVITAFVFILASCGAETQEPEPLPTASPDVSQEPAEEPSEEPVEEMTFTLEDLAQYDGQDGRPAYVAVDGVVYDLTNSAAWRNGKHNGFTAGKDLTEEIKEISPHGVINLEDIPVVGKLADD